MDIYWNPYYVTAPAEYFTPAMCVGLWKQFHNNDKRTPFSVRNLNLAIELNIYLKNYLFIVYTLNQSSLIVVLS